jgi:hypothetical protein
MHRQTARDFRVVEQSFERTARSVCNQSDDNFIFMVVCNEKPDIQFTHENIHYHIVDFPPAENIPDTTSKRLDKGTKLISGLLKIKQFNPKYVHIIDADDWVIHSLNQFLNSKPTQMVGWYISAGYTADLNTNRKQLKFGVNRFCDNTFITNYATLIDRLNISGKLTETSSQDEIYHTVDKSLVLDLFDSHGYIEYFSQYNLKYKVIPFPALVWLRNTGENILSDGSFNSGIPIDSKFLELFSQGSSTVAAQHKIRVKDYLMYTLSSAFSFIGWVFSRQRNLFKS